MKTHLRIFALTAATLLLSAMPTHASNKKPNNPGPPNVVDVNAGQLNLNLDQTFTTIVGTLGINTTFHGTHPVPAGFPATGRGFRVYGGQVDTSSGEGEFQSVGTLEFANGTTTVQLRHLTLDTTGAAPVITAELLLNGSMAGRVPVFTLITNDLFSTPVNGSSFTTPAVPVAMADSFVTLFNSLFNLKVMTLGLGAGTVSASATIGPIAK